jgi:K+-transporting ATPase KdpF subunit
LSNERKETVYARPDLCLNHNLFFRIVAGLRTLLRPRELGRSMHTVTILMLAVSTCTMIYLLYALLRPEKF